MCRPRRAYFLSSCSASEIHSQDARWLSSAGAGCPLWALSPLWTLIAVTQSVCGSSILRKRHRCCCSLGGRRWEHALNMPPPCTCFIFNGPVGWGVWRNVNTTETWGWRQLEFFVPKIQDLGVDVKDPQREVLAFSIFQKGIENEKPFLRWLCWITVFFIHVWVSDVEEEVKNPAS